MRSHRLHSTVELAAVTPAGIFSARLAQDRGRFPDLPLVPVPDVFGIWAQARQTHFADGGVIRQI
jgi:ABC-type sulfate transport system substrate-binding protein